MYTHYYFFLLLRLELTELNLCTCNLSVIQALAHGPYHRTKHNNPCQKLLKKGNLHNIIFNMIYGLSPPCEFFLGLRNESLFRFRFEEQVQSFTKVIQYL